MVSRTRVRAEILQRTDTEWGIEVPSSPSLNQDNLTSGTITGTQKTVSEGHPFGRLGKTSADVGGEFYSSRCKAYSNSPYIEVRSPSSGFLRYYFKGRIFPRVDHSVAPIELGLLVEPSADALLDSMGSTAISHVIPTNPVAGMGVTLGELHEGFPKLMGTLIFKRGLKKILQGSGDEFLNYEFGIKPLINDLLKWAHAYSHADKLWDQFLKNSGKKIHRRYTFPKYREVVESSITPNQPCYGDGIQGFPDLWQGGQNSFDLFTEKILERDRWFSGTFTYFVDMSKDQQSEWKRHRRRLDYLYGTKITPQVLWNLAPWSWAADWFANTGAIITNLTRFSEDGLVMPYGYMMETSVLRATYRMRNVTPLGYTIPDLTQVFTRTVKYRRRATPYGFGLSEVSFTPRQLAIISALGLSRL